MWNTGLDLLCGLAAGWSQIIVGQPLDYIKTKMQLSKLSHPSFREIGKQIFTQHGLLGFYRGASSLFYGFAFIIALEFAIYQRCKAKLMEYRNASHLVPEDVLSLWEIALSGSIVGLSVSFVYCPIEYSKIIRQTNPSIKEGSSQILLREIRQGHFGKIYQGLSATIMREFIGSAIYFSAYENTVRALCKSRGMERRFARYSDFLIGGSSAGLAYWIVSYPWDVIKTKIQAGQQMKTVLRDIKKTAYKGFGIVAVRSVTANAISFATFEQTKSIAQLFKAMTDL